MTDRPNRLIDQKSPYLLKHAHNPVDWHPWDEEAFDLAETEDKLIFLSIGYSTCHWCHVMERESFEDQEVAAMLNRSFVSIKVDREERPDIDAAFMSVCQMMTGSGGWPLTLILTPDGRPFFAATYLPKQSRFGRVGLVDLLPRLELVWKNRRDEVYGSAAKVVESLAEPPAAGGKKKLTGQASDQAYEQLKNRFDPTYAGFGNQPKFPTPHNLLFLLGRHQRTGDERALEMVELTLESMARGGIFDQVGFGFHRYSTDRGWLLPHFEKMLYDQALIALAYLEGFRITGRPEFARAADRVFTYVRRDLASDEGAFYSAEDADSEGEEGRFYLWSLEELSELLDPEEIRVAVRVFNLTADGNFLEESTQKRTGANVLYRRQSIAELARSLELESADLTARLEAIRDKLYQARRGRVRPDRDDKILTDWNGLMIAALARGGRVLDRPDLIEAAEAAAKFILGRLTDQHGRLLHRFREGEAAIPGFADDYAYLVWGLIELHQAGQNPDYLKSALQLTDDLLVRFWAEEGGVYQTAEDAEEVLSRLRQVYDGATPSANSVTALNLIRLARLSGRVEYEIKARQIFQAFIGQVAEQPSGHTLFLQALDQALAPGREVVVVGPAEGEDTRALIRTAEPFCGGGTTLLVKPDGPLGEQVALLAEFTAEMTPIEGRAAAYVCTGQSCAEPVTDPDRLLDLLRGEA